MTKVVEGKIPQTKNYKMSKYLEKYILKTKISKQILKNSPLYRDVLVPGCAKIIENPSLDDYFPDFGSYCQKYFLPLLIQDAHSNSPFLKATLPTRFPPKVDKLAKTINKKVTIQNPIISRSINYTSILSYGSISNQWLSTGLYAKQGELVTVTTPENMKGNFGIQISQFHCNNRRKNLRRWNRKDKNWAKRAAWIDQYYKNEDIQEKTKILTPYGGLIYIVVDAYNEYGDFELEFENVLESPRFVF